MGFFDSISPLFRGPQALSPQVSEAIELAGELVGPMLRAAPGYPQRLAESARHALSYCYELAQAIPGPLEINRHAFAADPLVHALFGRSADVGEMLGRSHVVREFLDTNVLPENFYALIGARRCEKRQFGMALVQDAVIKDVPQTTLYFSDHTVTEPATSVEGARKKLQTAMFRGLVENYALHVSALVHEQEQTTLDLAMEKAGAAARGAGVHGIAHVDQSRRVEELRAALGARAKDLTPERLLIQLAACFREPGEFLRLDTVAVAVDRMGVVAESEAAKESADKLQFVELTSRDRRQWVVVLAKLGRDEAREAVRQVKQATRYMII